MKARTWQLPLGALIAVALAVSGVAIASGANHAKPGAGRPAVTIGSKNFPEEVILGQLYAQALQAQGFKVTLKGNIGSSEIVDKALTSGKLDMYPEYTGTILSELAHQTKNPSNANDAYNKAKKFEQSRGFTLLNKTPFFDSDAIGVLKSYAQKNKLSSVADLKKLGKKFKVGALPEFRTRFTGLVGLKQKYGVVPTFVPLGATEIVYTAIDSGKINGGDVFTTDAQLASGKYTLLKDPKFIFGFQNVAPVVSQKKLKAEGPAFARTLNAVSAKLTTPAIQAMNKAVVLDKQNPAKVAAAFLKANKLG
jgi:osmoprotectant transport system substrate-binding protein